MSNKNLKQEQQRKYNLNEKADWILCAAFCATMLFFVGAHVYDIVKYKQEVKKTEQLKQSKSKQLNKTLSFVQNVK